MASKKAIKKSSIVKAGKVVKVEHVRVSSDKPNAAVKFKVVKSDAAGNMVVRATMRGEKPLFIKGNNGAWKAGMRGESPVAAKDPGQAFQKAVRANWA